MASNTHLPIYIPRVVHMLRPASWLSTGPQLLLLQLLLLLPLLLTLPKVQVIESRLRACCSDPPATQKQNIGVMHVLERDASSKLRDPVQSDIYCCSSTSDFQHMNQSRTCLQQQPPRKHLIL